MRKLGLVLILACLVALLLLRRPQQQKAAATPSDSVASAAAKAVPVEPHRSRVQARRVDGMNLWKEAQSKLGSELIPTFGEDGRLLGLRGRMGQGRRAGPNFDPADPQKAIARAKEILAAVEGSLGVTSKFPLTQPIARGNASSAQVYFRESYGSTPIAPFGKVVVDLGPQGELLRLDSSYVGEPEIVNGATLSEDEGRLRAMAAAGTEGKAEGGKTLLWISRDNPAGAAQGLFAYEFFVSGRQIVVDAQSGKILSDRDRRQF